MVARGSSAGYATDRVSGHAAALHALCDGIERGGVDDDELARTAARDDAPTDVTAFLTALDPTGPEARSHVATS
jgi:predicted glycosyl hydrolase (DUF1957 family)